VGGLDGLDRAVAVGGVAVAVFDGEPVPHAVRTKTIGAIAIPNDRLFIKTRAPEPCS
jgi:hypothetical protein